MRWVKFPSGILRGPAFSLCSLAARGLFAILFCEADELGRINVPPTATVEEFVRAWAYDPTDSAEPNKAFDQLVRFRLVAVDPNGLFVPARCGIATDGKAPQGDGSRGGRTAAERARDYRAQRKAERTVTDTVTVRERDANGSSRDTVTDAVTGNVTEPNRDANRDANGLDCDASRNIVTGHMVTQPSVIAAVSPTVTGNVTGTPNGERALEENREEEKRESQSARDSVMGTVTAPNPLPLSSVPTAKPTIPWDVSIPAGYGEEILAALREGGGEKIEAQAPAQVVLGFVKLCHSAGYVAKDLRALGAFLASGGAKWTDTKRFGLAYLSRNEGSILAGLITDARASTVAKARPVPTEPQKITRMDPEESARIQAAYNARKKAARE